MPNESGVLSLLRTKLAHIDQDCEREIQVSLSEICRGIKYDGGRFHVPDFQKVAGLLLRAIACKEQRFNAEIARVLGSPSATLLAEELELAFNVVSPYFQDDLYINRFDRFVESVGRAGSRYGLQFDPQLYRVDLASALFVSGVKNGTRRGLASVHAELAVYQRHQPVALEMTAPGLNEIVDLKPNFMGIGINLNALIKRIRGKFQKRNK